MLRRIIFNLWYLRKPPWDSGISPPELIEFIHTHPPGKAIDLGCGTGTNVITLSKAGWRVTGIDFAPRAIRMAKTKLEHENINADLQVGDVTKLDNITGPFDLALDIGCFHSLPQQGKLDYLTQLERILAPSGFWLIYGFVKPDPSTVSGQHPLQSGPGLGNVEINLIASRFSIVSRQNGLDRRKQPSAWLLFHKT